MFSRMHSFLSVPRRDKPQPIRSVGNTHGFHWEQNESKMFINGLSSSRGCSFVAAALAIAAVAGLAGAASASMVATNLITNGNFSDNAAAYASFPGYSASPNPADPTGWSGTNGVNGPDTGFYPTTSDNEPFSPAPNATINGNLPDFAFMQGPDASVAQTVATTPGSSYTLTYYGAARAGETADVLEVIATNAADSQQIAMQTPAIINTGWTPFTLSFIAPSASTNLEFLNNGTAGSTGTVDVTDVAMTPVPEPAAVGLFALGGLGMLLISRKRAARRSA